MDQGLNIGGGVVGFLILILNVIVIMEVINSNRTLSAKLGWSLFVFFFPIVGVIAYFLFKDRHQASYQQIA